MEFLDPIIGFMADKEFTVPVSQVATLIALNTFCLLFGKHKLGLLLSYAFVFYWGFVFNRAHFITVLGETQVGLYVYAIMGIAMVIMALLGFLRSPD